MSDNLILLAKIVAEMIAAIITFIFWINLDSSFSLGSLVVTVVVYLVLRNIFSSIAALLFH